MSADEALAMFQRRYKEAKQRRYRAEMRLLGCAQRLAPVMQHLNAREFDQARQLLTSEIADDCDIKELYLVLAERQEALEDMATSAQYIIGAGYTVE